MSPSDERAKARQAARRALDQGQVFAAYDLARAGLERHPGDQCLRLLGALALVRTGAVEAAREEVARTEVAALEAGQAARQGALGLLLAETCEAIGQTQGGHKERERAFAIRLARTAIDADVVDTARAALLAKQLGRLEQARALAGQAMHAAKPPVTPAPALLLDLVELAIVFGQQALAIRQLDKLADLVGTRPMQRVLVRRRLLALQAEGAPVSPAWIERFGPARVLIYTGPRAGSGPDAFTPDLEDALFRAIASLFDELRPEIAFGAASAGCDLLFTEALLARGAALNLVLPFECQDFRERLVAPHGPRWIERFERALERASSLVEVCREPYLGDDAVLRFGNRVIDGTARLRGAALASPPHLVAVFDYLAEPLSGSPSDFIDQWGDPARLRLIDLDEVRPAGAERAVATDVPVRSTAGAAALGKQTIATLLFADVVGYSQLRDNELPRFWHFMEAVTAQMAEAAPAPRLIDSWGDAILAVHDRALDAADYALALREGFSALDSRDFGLDQRLQLRIALHAGPLFERRHPLTGQHLVYGGNVNRAARIEPITIPGHVYASEQFVAVVTAEESAVEAEIRLQGGLHRPRHRCLYRGILDLAKGYGTQSLYEITPWQADAGAVELAPGRHLHVVLSNELGEHRRLAELFAQLVAPSGMPEEDTSVFELAFDEILTNICHYAWTDQAVHAIDVEVVVADDRIEATFRDDGEAFDPLAGPEADLVDDLEERAVGGLGIHLVRELMDDVRYAREGAVNRLTIVKQVGHEGLADSAGRGTS